MISKENFLKKASLFLVLFAPIIFWRYGLFPHVSSKTFFIYLLVEILLAFWLYLILIDRSYRLSKQTLIWYIPLFLFVLWSTVTGLTGANFNLSFWSSLGRGTGLLTLYHCLALSFVVASLVKKHGAQYVNSLFKYFVIGSLLLSISVWLGTDGFNLSADVFRKDAGGGFGGNSTLTAGYLLFSMAFAVFLLYTKDVSKKVKRWAIVLIFFTLFSPLFINLHGLLTGKSILGSARGTILALASGAGAGFLGYMFFSGKRNFKYISLGLLSIAIIIFGIMWSQLNTPGTNLNNKFAEQARSTRFIFWDIAQKAMDEKPIIGYGPENFSVVFQKNFNPQVLIEQNSFEGWVDRAHNVYYDVGSTSGYPAIILYCIFILSLFYAIYRANANGNLNKGQSGVIVGLLIGYIVNNLFTFESNLSLLALFLLSGIMYSIILTTQPQKKLRIDKTDTYKLFIGGVLTILLIVSLAYFVYRPILKSSLYARVFASSVDKRPDVYQLLIQGSSIGEDMDVGNLAYEVHKKYSANPASIKNDSKILPYAIKDIIELLNYLDSVSEHNKTDSRLYITKALLQNTLTYLTDRPFNQDTQAKILSDLEYASYLSPTNPNIYWAMAQTKLWGNDLQGAELAYRKSISVDPYLRTSYTLTLRYAQIIGNRQLFDEVLKEASKYIPGYELK